MRYFFTWYTRFSRCSYMFLFSLLVKYFLPEATVVAWFYRRALPKAAIYCSSSPLHQTKNLDLTNCTCTLLQSLSVVEILSPIKSQTSRIPLMLDCTQNLMLTLIDSIHRASKLSTMVMASSKSSLGDLTILTPVSMRPLNADFKSTHPFNLIVAGGCFLGQRPTLCRHWKL